MLTPNPAYRIVFPSYDWDDAWLVNQIINLPVVLGKENIGFIKGVPQEEGLTHDSEIQQWIDRNMSGCSALMLLVGEQTYLSKWVAYEVDLARKRHLGMLLVYLDGMRRQNGSICQLGKDPLEHWGLYANTPGCYRVNAYHWVRNNGLENVADWIEDALQRISK